MAISDDVLVIGGGLAGVSSALAAAQEGVRVRLISHKKSTLRNASGLIDLLGYADGELVADPFEAIPVLPEGHPYERVGIEAIRGGFSLFDEAVGASYLGAHTDRNALVPTYGGTVKPTARYPVSTAAGLASDSRSTLLVGFEGLSAFDAPLAAEHLQAADVPFDVHGVSIAFPKRFRSDATAMRFARALDRDEPAENGESHTRDVLVETVKAHLDGAERVGFPALLGEDTPEEVRGSLESALGVDVFEVPMGPPSLPGLRLEDRLYEALDEAGVRVTTGNPVAEFDTENGRITTVYTDRGGQRVPFEASEVVLATGGLVGKGIGSNRKGVYEPVFDCYVSHPEERSEWSREGAFDDHPFARFGVSVDRDMQPLDAEESAEYGNLRAAGSVLGGYDLANEKSGSGVSIATGYAAGRAAGEHA
ncbi:anaerobic glycerol-3-phosphate dehydrogenase subunit B [Halobacteriales archaeon QH_8_64_26]|nr:MAG: anaerobic glycerol-3-phosphate dehydrogenase subunit B [Halobacteriales archaeon QH_8_64_26]